MVSHRLSWAKLGRDSAHRMAMLRNMVTSLIQHERIVTTHPKAKAAQRLADRMVSLAKEGTPQARAKALGFVYDKTSVSKLFDDLAERYKTRPGGYTRVMRVKERMGDNAPLSFLEFVDRQGELRPAAVCTEEYHAQKVEQLATQRYNIGAATPATPAAAPSSRT